VLSVECEITRGLTPPRVSQCFKMGGGWQGLTEGKALRFQRKHASRAGTTCGRLRSDPETMKEASVDRVTWIVVRDSSRNTELRRQLCCTSD
jgi:hypothetical protein